MEAKQKINAYINKAAPFAQDICKTLRKIIHTSSRNIVEDIKWGSPAFVYKGKVLCWIWAFTHHASIGFFQGALIKDKYKLFNSGEDNLRGRAIKFTDVSQIEEKKIIDYLHQAIKNIDEGKFIKVPVSKVKKSI